MECSDPDKVNIEGTYTTCYHMVFGRDAPVTRITPEQARQLSTMIPDKGITVRLYILAAMVAFHEGNPDRRFYARQLIGPVAERHVEMYRRAAALRYGVFDMTTFTAMTSSVENTTQVMSDSEWMAASWVVNYRIHKGEGALTSLYRAQELNLDPRWLSTELTYARWLKGTPPVSDALKQHRYRVTQASREDWRHERENILPGVLSRMLNHHHQSATDFEVISPVSQPMAFWAALGDALLQIKAIDLLCQIS